MKCQDFKTICLTLLQLPQISRWNFLCNYDRERYKEKQKEMRRRQLR